MKMAGGWWQKWKFLEKCPINISVYNFQFNSLLSEFWWKLRVCVHHCHPQHSNRVDRKKLPILEKLHLIDLKIIRTVVLRAKGRGLTKWNQPTWFIEIWYTFIVNYTVFALLNNCLYIKMCSRLFVLVENNTQVLFEGKG